MTWRSSHTHLASLRVDPDEILADSTSALGHDDILEGRMERPLGRLASIVFLAGISVGMGYLIWRGADLQIASGEAFFEKSQENRFVTRPIFPPRGIIYDRAREPMVENVPSFALVFERDELVRGRGDLRAIVTRLETLLKKTETEFFEMGFPEDYLAREAPARIFIVRDLPIDSIVSLAPHLADMPGIQIVERYQRKYPSSQAMSHLLGYVGKVSDEDLAMRPELKNEEAIGKAGIEAFYDDVVRGKGGKKIIEINSRGGETRFRLTQEPHEGASLILTIDRALQELVYEIVQAYTEGKKGASVVAIDPRDGAVRALVSMPGFDASAFSSNLTRKEFIHILADPLKPLFNRAIAGEFPSGSVIKPLVATAALEEKIIDPHAKIFDPGFLELPNPYNPKQISVFRGWKPGGHGWVDLYDAIAQSVNVYFYMIGGGYKDQKGLGIERFKKYMTAFGLGSRLGIDLPGEKDGFIPDPESKSVTDPANPIWRVGDTYNVSIGQGGLLITPLQMAAATAAIANGGKLYKPQILRTVLDGEGRVARSHDPYLIRADIASEESIKEVQKGMRLAVSAGTAGRLADLPVSSAAKTGTAQAGSGNPHAWVTAYAPAEHPTLVVAVMVEHAGEGSTVAVPIMREILNWYFTHRE